MKQIFNAIIVFLLVGCAENSKTTYDEIKDPILVQPKFPGGNEELQKFLNNNYIWEQGQETVEGTVVVQFTVLENGSVVEPKVVRSLCGSCDQEAIRLMTKMPKWEPVIKDGKPVREKMYIPIRFGLTNSYK